MNRQRAHVRRAGPDDAQELSRIGRTTYIAHFANIWSRDLLCQRVDAHFSEARMLDKIADPHCRAFLAGIDDEIVGYAMLHLGERCSARPETYASEISKLYLLPAGIRIGLGARMLREACAAACEYGPPNLWLRMVRRKDNAFRFYQSNGFAVIGEQVFETDIMDVGYWIMFRSEAER
mgnify:CR=1 FL=1